MPQGFKSAFIMHYQLTINGLHYISADLNTAPTKRILVHFCFQYQP